MWREFGEASQGHGRNKSQMMFLQYNKCTTVTERSTVAEGGPTHHIQPMKL